MEASQVDSASIDGLSLDHDFAITPADDLMAAQVGAEGFANDAQVAGRASTALKRINSFAEGNPELWSGLQKNFLRMPEAA